MPSAEKAAGAAGGNAAAAREPAAAITASRDAIDSLTAALTSLGIEIRAKSVSRLASFL